jgi:CDP-glucose 4,6-dehydratase
MSAPADDRASKPFDDAFRGRSVLVTGHTGFKGSWLSLWLSRLGAKVTGYSLDPPTQPNHFELCRVRETLAEHHTADIRHLERLQLCLEEAQPDVVLHLAAQSVVRQGYRSPLDTFSINVTGTACILEAVRLSQRPCVVVVVSSDKCYENHEAAAGHRENDPMGERDPYGASKGAAELVVRSYRESFFPADKLRGHGVKLASARAGNVIGGGDWKADGLIADVVRALARREAVELRQPGAIRPWQHVLQALSGYLTLASRLLRDDDPALCSGWNIGPLPGNDLTVREVIEQFLAIWGEGEWRDVSDREHLREAHTLRLCIDKARSQLHWRPCWTTSQVLVSTADWYRRWLDGAADLQQLSLAQIAAYEEAMRSNAAAVSEPSLVTTATI